MLKYDDRMLKNYDDKRIRDIKDKPRLQIVYITRLFDEDGEIQELQEQTRL